MRQGFTLIELAVVLVIIGFLVGGVMTGRSLIKAAELRNVTREFVQYKAVIADFKDRYGQLPGDFNGATGIWGAANATPATCFSTASGTVATCDGDGDGVVAPSTGSNERFRFWQHLVNAQLLEGSFDGITHGSTDSTAVAGINVPASKFSKGAWYGVNKGIIKADASFFELDYGNVLLIGAEVANATPAGALFTPSQLKNLDEKMDDGRPASGMLVGYPYSTCTTATGYTDYTALYQATVTTPTCAIFFRNAF